MGNKSSNSSSLISKNWQKISPNIYRNVLTSELVRQKIMNFSSQQEMDSAFRKYVQRVNLSQLDIVKLVYFIKQNQTSSICSTGGNQNILNVYFQFVQQDLDLFIDKFKPQYLQDKGQGCFCQSLLKAAIYLSQKYDFFKVTSKNVYIDILQSKKSLKKYRAKIWINQDCSVCDVEQNCSQQQMIFSLKDLLKQKIIKNNFCSRIKVEQFQGKLRHFSSLRQLIQKVNQAHSTLSNFNKASQVRQSEDNIFQNVRSFSSNQFYSSNKSFDPNSSLNHINKINSTQTYQKNVLLEARKVQKQIKLQNLKYQTYINSQNHEQKVNKAGPTHALTQFFSYAAKNNSTMAVDSFRNSNLSQYRQKPITVNNQYSYSPIIANNFKQPKDNENDKKSKPASIQFHFSNKQSQKSINNSSNGQNKKLFIKQFKTGEKATDSTDRTKNQISSKNQQKQTYSAINSSRKNNRMAPSSLSSTYGASQFPPSKNQKQDFQLNNLIKEIPQRNQTQILEKRHSSKDHISMKQQQSNSSKAYSTSNMIICQDEDFRLKNEFQMDKKYEKYYNKLKKITQDKKIQNQIQSIRNSKIKQQKYSELLPYKQNTEILPYKQNISIRKQSAKMTKSIHVSSQKNQSLDNSNSNNWHPHKGKDLSHANQQKDNNLTNNNYIKFTSLDQIQQRQSFNFDYAQIKESKFVRTGSKQYMVNYPLKDKQYDNIKHNKQYRQLPSNVNQTSEIPRMQKKNNVSLNLKDQMTNLLGSDNTNTNKSYSHKVAPHAFNNKGKELLDSLSNKKSGINGQINSIYNESISNLSVREEQEQNLKKSRRQKQIIKEQMESLLRITTSNQDDHSIKAKVKHKREIFSQLKAQALKILD